MHTVHKTPAVTATARPTRDLDADLLIIPVFEDDDLSDEPDLDRGLGWRVRRRARSAGRITGQSRSSSCLPRSAATDGRRAVRSGSASVARTGPHDRAPAAGCDHRRRWRPVSGALASIAIARARRRSLRTERRRCRRSPKARCSPTTKGCPTRRPTSRSAWLERVEMRVAGRGR